MLFRQCFGLLHLVILTAFLSAGCSVNTELLGSDSESSTTPLVNKSEYTVQFGAPASMFMLGGADTDSEGNLYGSGLAMGDFGGSTQIGAADALAVKYSNAGTLEWVAREGVAASMAVANRVSYADGYVYTVGYTWGSIGGQIITGAADLFVAKYDAATGARIWLRLLGSPSYSVNGSDLIIDSNGDIFVCGNTSGSVGGQSMNGVVDAFVAKYADDGTLLWVRQFGEATRVVNTFAIGLDNTGNIYLSGVFSGSFDGHTAVGSIDGHVLKLNSAGTKVWSRALGSTPGATVGILDMVVDGSGNSYLSGYTNGDLDGNTLVGNKDQVVAKFDTSGVKKWTKLYTGGAGTYQEAFAITLDSNNHVITGGGDNFNDGGTYGWTIIRWDTTTGAQVDIIHETATGGGATIAGISADAQGYVEAVGMVWGALSGQTLTGTLDGFVVRRKYN